MRFDFVLLFVLIVNWECRFLVGAVLRGRIACVVFGVWGDSVFGVWFAIFGLCILMHFGWFVCLCVFCDCRFGFLGVVVLDDSALQFGFLFVGLFAFGFWVVVFARGGLLVFAVCGCVCVFSLLVWRFGVWCFGICVAGFGFCVFV